MKVIGEVINGISVTVGGWIGYIVGGYDGFIYALVTFVIIDYITGIMCAILEKNLASELGYKGIAKKVALFILVAVANIIDRDLIGDGSVIRTAVIFFYLSNEGLSIIENIARLGVPIPGKLQEVLVQLKKKGEDE